MYGLYITKYRLISWARTQTLENMARALRLRILAITTDDLVLCSGALNLYSFILKSGPEYSSYEWQTIIIFVWDIQI